MLAGGVPCKEGEPPVVSHWKPGHTSPPCWRRVGRRDALNRKRQILENLAWILITAPISVRLITVLISVRPPFRNSSGPFSHVTTLPPNR